MLKTAVSISHQYNLGRFVGTAYGIRVIDMKLVMYFVGKAYSIGIMDSELTVTHINS